MKGFFGAHAGSARQTRPVSGDLILCEQIYLGFQTTIVKAIVGPMNGPTLLQLKNTICHNLAALRGLSV